MESINANSQHINQDIDNRKLDRNDLEFIITLANDRGFKTEISDHEYKYESTDEVIKEKGSTPKRLEIVITDPNDNDMTIRRTSIDICNLGVSVNAFASVDLLNTTREIIERLQNAKQRINKFIEVIGYSYWPSLIIINALAWLGYTQTIKTSLAGLLVITTVTFFGIAKYTIEYMPAINLERKHENFFSRNKDKLVLLIIGTIIGVLVTGLTKMFA